MSQGALFFFLHGTSCLHQQYYVKWSSSWETFHLEQISKLYRCLPAAVQKRQTASRQTSPTELFICLVLARYMNIYADGKGELGGDINRTHWELRSWCCQNWSLFNSPCIGGDVRVHNALLKEATGNKVCQSPILVVSQAGRKQEVSSSTCGNNAWKENRRESLLRHKPP